MIDKSIKNKILKMYNKKEEKIFVGKVFDDINKFETKNIPVLIGFLDLYEKKLASDILNVLDVPYIFFDVLEDIQKSAILLTPDYVNENNIWDDYITCIKITTKSKIVLEHRQYMGAIYSLGINEKIIGDIIVSKCACYAFFLSTATSYVLNNLNKIGKIDVSLEPISVYSEEIKDLHLNFKKIPIIVSSLRVDNILSSLYNLSRNEVKAKIEDGDLVINSKQIYFPAYILNEGDIVAFKRCGKFKMGNIIGQTKSNKISLNIDKYV